MSDVGIAPAPAAPSSSGEVPINPNPVSPPQPIGSQAPPAPVGDVEGSKLHPQSRREAARESIRKAFERTTEPGPAKPRMGHNQPPEEMKKEKAEPPKGPPLNLKKRPVDQEPQASGVHTPSAARERGEHGHFAPKETTQPAAGGQAVQKQLPPHAPYREPPRRMDAQAKAEWAAAPESVRGAVTRMHKEFSAANKNCSPPVMRWRRCFRTGTWRSSTAPRWSGRWTTTSDGENCARTRSAASTSSSTI